MPCTNGASNGFNRFYGSRREILRGSQQSESSSSPITTGCIGERDLLTVCRLYNTFWEGRVGVETSSVLVCRAE